MMIEHALELAARGWSVVPLQEREKKPYAGFDLMKYQRDQRAGYGTLITWWKRWPTANIAICTGMLSGLFVWDCDTPGAYTASVRRGLPDTLTVRTGKGYHVYFKMPDFPLGNRARPLPGIDVRGTGGYVVAPPSIHPSGAAYEWLNDCPVMPAPDWILEVCRLTRHTNPIHFKTGGQVRNATAYGMAALQSEAREVASTTTNRNDRLFRAALKMGSLIADGKLDHDTVVSTLLNAAAHLSADDGQSATYRTILSGINTGVRSPREKFKK